MIGFAETLGAAFLSFLLPAFVGICIFVAASRLTRVSTAAAFALGLYFWFFVDTLGDASLLGLSQGLSGGISHVLLWIVFALGLGIFMGLDRELFAAVSTKRGLTVPILMAVAIGMHGLGEGAGIGATASTTPATDLLSAFGGLTQAAAFVIHKALEPMMAGAAYVAYSNVGQQRPKQTIADVAMVTFAFALPGILGGAAGYYAVLAFTGVDFTYLFAFGLGTSIYAVFRLAGVLLGGKPTSAAKVAIAFLAGFTCLYLAALLHA